VSELRDARVIDSLLVANRGEIACRIFKTARRLGVRTIAVYSEVDAQARHVREADAAVCIGGPAARDSYLNVGRILEAAAATGARAVHPGYGFLAEHASFAAACSTAGLIFVGPPAAAMAAMGSKIVAKSRMRAAGVPVLAGYEGELQDLGQLEAEARRLPLPLMIKPAAGGGGKGMQVVSEAAQIPAALAAARRLAESAFGDGTLLLERFLTAPRHVEVQVFADTLGHVLHLGDRDCSVQRRHQKVIEEAPAPEIADEVRQRMRSAALVVAREIGYVGAGTVEFLLDAGEFYFMEMNTRLQVEHTVTEAITGLDLVEWQLRVASGEALPLEQSQVAFRGHAIEARVCAEDPERDFLPSSGPLQVLSWPQGESVRVDAGFEAGDTVPSTYDSLLGKVIAWAPQRTEAAARLASSLDRTYCAGVHTNERWLARILRDERFLAARHSVAFLRESGSQFQDQAEPDAPVLALAALAVWQAQRGEGPWGTADGFMPNLPATVGFAFRKGERRYEVELDFRRGTPVGAVVDGTALTVADISLLGNDVSARFGPVLLKGHVWLDEGERAPVHLHLWAGARHFEFLREDPRNVEYSSSAGGGGLTTPLPGVVVAISVKPGQRVVAGEALMVLEAMKMEHTITAPRAGTVKAIHCAPGDRVPEGKALLEIE
jgi:3-methylcrotonyl-CoA carboxylase alpha subunit